MMGGLRKVLRVIVIVVAGAIGAVIGKGVVSHLIESGEPVFTESDADQMLLGQGKMFHTLKREFPADYEQLLQEVRRIVKTQGSDAQVQTEAFNAMRKITVKYAIHIKSAPDEMLTSIVDGYALLPESIRTQDGVELCNSFAAKGGIALLGNGKKYSKTISVQGDAILRAFRFGIDNPSVSVAATDSDWVAVGETMVNQGATEAQLTLLAEEKYMEPGYCDAVILLLKAMMATRGEAGHRVRADFVYGVVSM